MSKVRVYDRVVSWRLPERVRASDSEFVRVDLLDAPTVCRLIANIFRTEYDTGWVQTKHAYVIVGIPRDDEFGFPVVLARVMRRSWDVAEAYTPTIQARVEQYLEGMRTGAEPVPGLALSRGIVAALRERGCVPYRGNGGTYLVPSDVDIKDITNAIAQCGGEPRVVYIHK